MLEVLWSKLCYCSSGSRKSNAAEKPAPEPDARAPPELAHTLAASEDGESQTKIVKQILDTENIGETSAKYMAMTVRRVILSLVKHAAFGIVRSKCHPRRARSEFLVVLQEEFKKIDSYNEYMLLVDVIISGYTAENKVIADSLAQQLAMRIVTQASSVCVIVDADSEPEPEAVDGAGAPEAAA